MDGSVLTPTAAASRRIGRYTRTVVKRYAATIPVFWTEAVSWSDFVKLMRVRLAKSKLGWLACPRPTLAIVDLKTLGPRIHLRSHATDISVLAELIESGSYAGISSVLPDASVIVDLGANTGLASRWFLHQYPQARVIAVEPEPGNVAMLRLNLEPAAGRARVVDACIGGNRRRVRMVTTQGEFAFRMEELTDVGPSSAVVDVVTMEEILAGADIDGIDLLKCDIEGAERELFANCASWIGRVRCAAVECHAPYSADMLLQDLARNGAALELVQLEPNPAFSCEVAILRRRD